jgi:hypothetical protein
MPLIIDEIDIVLEPPPGDSGDAGQFASASVSIAEEAFEDLLRFLTERQRRVLVD